MKRRVPLPAEPDETRLMASPVHALASRLFYEDHFHGCRDFYFDVGSNVGVQVRKLFEPEKYRGARVLPLFDRIFGDAGARRANPGLCAIGFEGNIEHVPKLRRIEACCCSRG